MYTSRLKPGLRTTDENPKFGSDGATTWKAGPPPMPEVNNGNIFETSMNDPGPIQIQNQHMIAATLLGVTYSRGRTAMVSHP